MSFGTGFLRYPELFPARHSGEPWGDAQVAIQFAGNVYHCHGLSATQATAIRERFAGLCLPPDAVPDTALDLRIFRASVADFVDDGRIWAFDFDLDYAPAAIRFAGFRFLGRLDWTPRLRAGLLNSEGAIDLAGVEPPRPCGRPSLAKEGNSLILEPLSPPFQGGVARSAGVVESADRPISVEFNGPARLRAALWTPEDQRLVSHAILENFLRAVVAYHLLEQGGVLLHSAAAADDHGAYLFFGPSGAGKSTISRLNHAAGRAVLSDDMNALRLTPDGVVVERLPFAGDFGQQGGGVAGAYPARALCRLHKGLEPALQPLSPAAAVAALLGCAPFVNQNPYRRDELIDRLLALNARLPVQALTFARDDRFWNLLGKTAHD